jgi:cytochrome b
MQKVLVWDLPTRIFHWLLAASVLGLFVTGEVGGNAMPWHGRLGIFVLGLVVFRLVWGFCGASYARFAQFWPRPRQIAAYLRGEWHGLGHNPLGALSVFALLGVSGLQAVLGLFADDDIAFQGPLARLIDDDLAGRLTGLHELGGNLLMLLVALHVCAIVFYARVKKDNLVLPMLTGFKEVDAAKAGPPARPGSRLGLVLAILLAALAMAAASGVWLAPPAAVPAAATPAW